MRISGAFTLLFMLASPAASALPGSPVSPADCSDSLIKKSSYQSAADVADMAGSASAAVYLGHCSGSYISDQGHILTAGHCLQNCAERAGLWKDRKPKEMECILAVDGVAKRVKVILASRCNPSQGGERRFKDGTDECPDDADLAIVLPDPAPSSFSCLEMATARPGPGEAIRAMGWPLKTERANGGNSDGTRLQVSKGRIVQQGYCDQVLADGSTKQVFIAGLKNVNTRLLQATADVIPRQSGGALLNRNGQLVGVAHAVVHANQKTECRGGGLFESLDRLPAMAKAWKAEAELANMKCSARKVRTPASGI